MAVQSALVDPGGGNATWLGVGGLTGLRVLVAIWDRSGGETATVTTDDPGWTSADFTLIADRPTLPTDGSNRRGVFLFESVVPAGITSNPIITVELLDGSSAAVDHSWVAIAVDESEAAGYILVTPNGEDDSGVSTTTSQGTGSTGTAPAGDVLLVAVEATRGSTTATWTATDNTPPNPGGGDWDLSSTLGTGASQRRGSVGYAVLSGQSSQTWSDTVTYGTARASSAVIVVFSTGAGGGANLSDTITETATATDTVTATLTVHREIVETANATDQGDDYTLDVADTFIETATAMDTVSAVLSGPMSETITEQATATDNVIASIMGAVLVDLHFIALTPVLAHGAALTPELADHTALTPELVAHVALTPETVVREAGEPVLAHGEVDHQLDHGDIDNLLAHGMLPDPSL